MSKRFLPVCAVIVAACGSEVTAREAPSLDGLATAAQEVGPPLAEPGADAVRAQPAAPDAVELALPALLYSDLDADVAARAGGVIESVQVDLGDAVRRGQVLARIDDARQVARHAAATAAVERARADHARMDGLHASGFVTSQELDEARYQLRTAEAALREAQVELDYTRIVAPFAGVVTRRHVGIGRAVREGEPLFRVTALQPLRATARLAERDARRLRPGTRALLTDEDGARVEALLLRVSPAVEPGAGTVQVVLGVPQPGPFLPGSSATLRLPLAPGPRVP